MRALTSLSPVFLLLWGSVAGCGEASLVGHRADVLVEFEAVLELVAGYTCGGRLSAQSVVRSDRETFLQF